MKNIFIGIAAGIVVGALLFMGYQDYKMTKTKVNAIEQYLIQAQQQAQRQRPPIAPEIKNAK